MSLFPFLRKRQYAIGIRDLRPNLNKSRISKALGINRRRHSLNQISGEKERTQEQRKNLQKKRRKEEN